MAAVSVLRIVQGGPMVKAIKAGAVMKFNEENPKQALSAGSMKT